MYFKVILCCFTTYQVSIGFFYRYWNLFYLKLLFFIYIFIFFICICLKVCFLQVLILFLLSSINRIIINLVIKYISYIFTFSYYILFNLILDCSITYPLWLLASRSAFFWSLWAIDIYYIYLFFLILDNFAFINVILFGNLCQYLSIYLSFYLFIYLSIHIYIYRSFYLFIYLFC